MNMCISDIVPVGKTQLNQRYRYGQIELMNIFVFISKAIYLHLPQSFVFDSYQ